MKHFAPLALALVGCFGGAQVNSTLDYSSSGRLPARVGLVVGVDATRLKQTAFWKRVSPKLAALAGSETESFLKLKATCDLDPFRDLRWLLYVADSGNEGKQIDEGVFIINATWTKAKVDACAMIQARDGDDEYEDSENKIPPGPYTKLREGWIGWIDANTAAFAFSRRGVPLLDEVITGSKTGPNPDLRQQLTRIDSGAVVWMAGVGREGSLDEVDPINTDALEHASGLAASLTLGTVLDMHITAEQEARHVGELAKTAAAVDRRLHEKLEDLPFLQSIKTSMEGRSVKIDAHLDAAGVDLLAGLITEGADREVAQNERYRDEETYPPEAPTPPAPEVPAAPTDADVDGIVDDADKCPTAPEDKDGFEDADGCPDPDNDADGIADAADQCPAQPEDRNAYEDQDGCPDEQKRAGRLAKAESHTLSGQAFLKAKVYDKAIEEFAAAYAIAPIPVLQYNIALAYDGLKDKAAALAAYRKYIDTDPDGARGKEGEYARGRIALLTKQLKK